MKICSNFPQIRYIKNNNTIAKQSNTSEIKTDKYELLNFGAKRHHYIWELDKIPITGIYKRSPRDIAYLKSIAKAVNCPVQNLQSLVGIDELKYLLKCANKNNFDPKHPKYMINLHTHTLWSDGTATVQEILDEAQQRGKKSGKNFLIAISDHDCIDSTREAIKLISQNPEKYNKIRFVAESEPCYKYENPRILKMPVPFDAVAYCINPFGELTRELFEKPIEMNKNYAKEVINKVNQNWGTDLSFDEACEQHRAIKTGGSTGFLTHIREYIENSLKKENIAFNQNELLEFFKPYYANQNGCVTTATTDIKDAIKLIKQSEFGEIGIAHPALVKLNPQEYGMDFISSTNLQNGISYNQAMEEFIKTCGLKMAEVHYQYPNSQFEKYPQFQDLINVINKTCNQQDILCTGGTDSHGNTFGKILESRH